MLARANNLANFLRRLMLPKPILGWTLTMLWEKWIKIGAKLVGHSKNFRFQLAKVAMRRQLLARILGPIASLYQARAPD